MPQAIIYLSEEEDKIIKEFSKKWELSKHETILKIIREFKEKKRWLIQ